MVIEKKSGTLLDRCKNLLSERRKYELLWIIYALIVTMCASIVHFTPGDVLCEEKGTCECGQLFDLSFIIYSIIIILSTIFKVIMKGGTRRELKYR